MSHQDDPSTQEGLGSPTSRRTERVGTLTYLTDGREYTLGFGSLRVGRQRRADIVVSDKTVSRHHADICYESGRYVLYDHSTNGTWVNGALVAVARPLRDRDRLKFGESEFVFALKPFDAAAARPGRMSLSDTLARTATRIIKGGRGEDRRGRPWLWVLLAIVVLLAAAAAGVYFFFPGLVERFLP